MSTRRSRSSRSREEITEQLSALTMLESDPDARRQLAMEYVRDSTSLEVLRAALAMLRDDAGPDARPVLHAKYEWCAHTPERRDSGGIVRAAIVRALQPMILLADMPILELALRTYQTVGLYDISAELRAAALTALADLDPDLAMLHAARFLRDPRNSNSGEPALTAVRLLAQRQQLAALVAYAAWPGSDEMPGWLTSRSEVLAEALRHLTGLPAPIVDLLVDQYAASIDEHIVLGVYDLLLGHPERARWRSTIARFLRSAQFPDLQGLVAMQIVVTRDPSLIELLREIARDERDPLRARMLEQALQHA